MALSSFGWRMIGAFPGPDRLTDVCEYDGAVYVSAEGSYQVDGYVDGTGVEFIGINNCGVLTEYPETLRFRRSGVGWIPVVGSGMYVSLPVRQLELTRLGYVGVRQASWEGLADGQYVSEGMTDVAFAAVNWGLHVAVGAVAPATEGKCLYTLADGEWTDASPEGMTQIYCLESFGGHLYAAGQSELDEQVLLRYDGSEWLEIATVDHEIRDLAVVDGALRAICGSRVFELRNWTLEQVAAYGGDKGTGTGHVGNELLEMVRTPQGEPISAAGIGAQGIGELGGRAYVVSGLETQQLSWVDGHNLRPVAGWSAEDMALDAVATHHNRLWLFGDDGVGAPELASFDGRQFAAAEPGSWRVDRVREGDLAYAVGRYLQRMENGENVWWDGYGQVVLMSSDGVMLDSLAHECSDGLSDGESPELDSLAHECQEEDNPVRLDGVTHQCSDGEGDSPELESLAHECMINGGDPASAPALESVAHECESVDEAERLDSLTHECADEEQGPGETEEVVFFVLTLDSPGQMLRIVTGQPLSADWRAIVRYDDGGADVHAWSTYEQAPLNTDFSPQQTGIELRVGIIGPWAVDNAPDVHIQVRRD